MKIHTKYWCDCEIIGANFLNIVLLQNSVASWNWHSAEVGTQISKAEENWCLLLWPQCCTRPINSSRCLVDIHFTWVWTHFERCSVIDGANIKGKTAEDDPLSLLHAMFWIWSTIVYIPYIIFPVCYSCVDMFYLISLMGCVEVGVGFNFIGWKRCVFLACAGNRLVNIHLANFPYYHYVASDNSVLKSIKTFTSLSVKSTHQTLSLIILTGSLAHIHGFRQPI